MKLEVKTEGKCMFGTSHWYGTINGKPAVATSWYSGAAMWFYAGKWNRKVFKSLADLYDYFGIDWG